MPEQKIDEKIELKVAPGDDAPAPPAVLTSSAPPPQPRMKEPFDPKRPSAYREWKKKQMANRPPARMTPGTLVMLCSGAVVLAVGMRLIYEEACNYQHALQLRDHPQVAEATVIAAETHKLGHYYEFKFTSADGSEQGGTAWIPDSRASALPPDIKIGTTIPVKYAPDGPCTNAIPGENTARLYSWQHYIFGSVFGLLFALSGLSLISKGMLRFSGAKSAKQKAAREAKPSA